MLASFLHYCTDLLLLHDPLPAPCRSVLPGYYSHSWVSWTYILLLGHLLSGNMSQSRTGLGHGHASTCIFLGVTDHVRTSGNDVVATEFSRWTVWRVEVFDRKGDEERSMGVRFSFGETLGASPHLNNSKGKYIYIYLRKRVKHRGDKFAHIFIHITQIPSCKETLLNQKWRITFWKIQ